MMQSKNYATIAAAICVMASTSSSALGACPPLTSPDGGRLGGQWGATVMGSMEKVPPPKRHRPIPPGPLSSVRIVLERSLCLGSCPAYRVEIRGDGSGLYTGEAHVLVAGNHRFRIPPETVMCLLEDFRAADFWSLAPNYVAPITDSPLHKLTLIIGGQRKVVNDYVGTAVGMPAVVIGLETAIDQASADRFVIGDAHTMADLRAENFDFKSDAGGALLARAAASGPDDLVLDLIAAGTPLLGRHTLMTSGRAYHELVEPAVIASAKRGRAQVVRALIKAGALSGDGQSLKNDAYLSAAASLDEATFDEVLATHPDINARGGDGKTALMLLKRPDYYEDPNPADGAHRISITTRLLAMGADATLRDHSGETALYFVREPEVVRLLVKAGAPLETRDEFGLTPLLAAETDDATVALLEAGADPRAVADDGETVLKSATSRHWARTLAFLAAHGITQ